MAAGTRRPRRWLALWAALCLFAACAAPASAVPADPEATEAATTWTVVEPSLPGVPDLSDDALGAAPDDPMAELIQAKQGITGEALFDYGDPAPSSSDVSPQDEALAALSGQDVGVTAAPTPEPSPQADLPDLSGAVGGTLFSGPASAVDLPEGLAGVSLVSEPGATDTRTLQFGPDGTFTCREVSMTATGNGVISEYYGQIDRVTRQSDSGWALHISMTGIASIEVFGLGDGEGQKPPYQTGDTLLVVLPGAAVNEADGRLIPTPSQRHRGVVHYDDDYYYIGVVPNEGRPTFLPFRVEG